MALDPQNPFSSPALIPSLGQLGASIASPVPSAPFGQPFATPSEMMLTGGMVNIDMLAAHVRSSYDSAKQHRLLTMIDDRLIRCQRDRDGRYSDETASLIKAKGGCDKFFNITAPKCDSAISRLSKVLNMGSDRLWSLEPTPVPDLTNAMKEQVRAKVVQEIMGFQQSQGPMAASEIYRFLQEQYAEEMRELGAEARRRAEGMQQKIDDQMEEGGFQEAFADLLQYLCTYPAAILEGPIVRMREQARWSAESGQIETKVVPVLTWEAINPHNFFPGQNVTDPDTGPIHYLKNFEKTELMAFRGTAGWSDEAIEAVCADTNPVSEEMTLPDAQVRAMMENRNVALGAGIPDGTVQGIVSWLSVPGSMLKQWRGAADPLEGEDDFSVLEDSDWYEVTTILIGTHIVRAILNPNTLKRRNVYVTWWEHVPGSIWGKALPEKMADWQGAYSASWRNAINNIAQTAGMQFFADLDALEETSIKQLGQGAGPGSVWQWRSSDVQGNYTGGAKPLEMFQPQMIADKILEIAQEIQTQADQSTGITSFTQGNTDLSGAGDTASGTSMLLSELSVNLKQVILQLDTYLMRRAIENVYWWNLNYLDDETYGAIKGDCRIVPKGAISEIIREALQMRRQEFLNLTNNPYDQAIMGRKGRAKLLAEIAKDLSVDVNEVIPPDDILDQWMQMDLATQMGMLQPPQAPGDASQPGVPGMPPPATRASSPFQQNPTGAQSPMPGQGAIPTEGYDTPAQRRLPIVDPA